MSIRQFLIVALKVLSKLLVASDVVIKLLKEVSSSSKGTLEPFILKLLLIDNASKVDKVRIKLVTKVVYNLLIGIYLLSELSSIYIKLGYKLFGVVK